MCRPSTKRNKANGGRWSWGNRFVYTRELIVELTTQILHGDTVRPHRTREPIVLPTTCATMSPKQCTHHRSSDDGGKGVADALLVGPTADVPDTVTERGEGGVGVADSGGRDGQGGSLELMRFAVEQMYEQADWVYELETSTNGTRDQRRYVLDSLVNMAHVGHRYLRHGDPEVREAADLLTTGTAYLIGRMYAAFGTPTSLLRWSASVAFRHDLVISAFVFFFFVFPPR